MCVMEWGNNLLAMGIRVPHAVESMRRRLFRGNSKEEERKVAVPNTYPFD